MEDIKRSKKVEKFNWNNPWIVGIGVAILGGIAGLIFAKTTYDNQQIFNADLFNYIDGPTVNENNGSIQQVIGNNNVITGSLYLDDQEKIWDEASIPIQNFVTKLNNNDFVGARNQLDKILIKNPIFFENELIHFMENVDGQVTIRDLVRDEAKKKDVEYVSNRGFYFSLRYLKNGVQINEKWRATTIKYLKEDNVWKIGELRCEDKRCENESVLSEKNF